LKSNGTGMVRAYLGLGGNIGNVRAAIETAVKKLNDNGARVGARSADYSTPPWGNRDQPPFVNACVAVETELSPRELLTLVLGIEREQGRVRAEKWGPRTLDIDILTYGSLIIDEPGLTLPHPHLLERAFVILPLAEIAPYLIVAGVRIADRAAIMDVGDIKRL
jgi:2-amino-4-hydroxy-6-hydroxymethyldihydropteridine diphosphokinase